MEKDDAKCYTECPEGYKHNYNNNICFEGECKSTNYKFSYDGDAKACYYSCKDISPLKLEISRLVFQEKKEEQIIIWIKKIYS